MRVFFALVVVLCALLATRDTAAQVHWDVSLAAGGTKRFLTDRPAGTKDSFVGPSAQLAAHLALLPLVHVGGYLGGELSPVSHAGTRTLGSGGLHVKGLIPFFPRSMRGWIYTGFGYTRMSQQENPPVPGRGGGFLEVPFGFGASYKLRKPWSVFAELGGKVGVAHSGSAYARGNAVDRLALGLSLGVMLEL